MKTTRNILTLIIIISTIIPSIQIKAEDPSQWILEERGDSYEIFYNSTHPALKRWNSAPLWIFNGSGYVPYIYSRDEAKKCYTIQSGLIAAELYDTGIAKFYDPELIEERVKSEVWQIWFLDKTQWKQATLSSVISFTITQVQNYIILETERSTSKPDGTLTIQYMFNAGSPLKHNVYWESASTTVDTIQVRQIWDLKLSTDKVLLEDGTLQTTSTETNSTSYLFGDTENDFLVSESHWSATYYPNGTMRENGFIEADVDFSGKKTIFTFGNWNLTQGETLEIDPDTATLSNPTVDGWTDSNGLTKRDDLTTLKFGKGYTTGPRYYRGYIEWSVTSIPDGATITDSIFKYDGVTNGTDDSHIKEMTGCRPSTSTYEQLVSWIDSADAYVTPWNPTVGDNQQIDLDTDADADLQASLGVNWFAIGFKGDMVDNNQYDEIGPEELGGVTPAPTLYVEYTTNVAPNAPTFNNPTNNTEFEPSTSVNISWTFSDPDGGDIQSAYQLQISALHDFSSLFYDSEKNTTVNEFSQTTFPQNLGEYYLRVRTWDNLDLNGSWSSTLFIEVAPAELGGGWSPSGSTPTDSTPLDSGLDDGAITPVSTYLNLGIFLIVGAVVFGLFWKGASERNQSGLDQFKSRREGNRRTSKEKEKQVPKELKRRRK